MSVKILQLAWGVFEHSLSPTEKNILARIAFFADDNGNAFPSNKTLAKETEFSVRTVCRTITSLVRKGLLKRKITFENNQRRLKINVDILKLLQEPLKKKHSNKDSADIVKGAMELLARSIDSVSTPIDSVSTPIDSVSTPIDSVSRVNVFPSPCEPTNMRQSGDGDFPKDYIKTKRKTILKTHTDRERVCVFQEDSLSQQRRNFKAVTDIWLKKESFSVAEKIYNTVVPEKISAEQVLAAAQKKIESIQAKYSSETERIRFCPNLKKWLEDEAYLDDPHIPISTVPFLKDLPELHVLRIAPQKQIRYPINSRRQG